MVGSGPRLRGPCMRQPLCHMEGSRLRARVECGRSTGGRRLLLVVGAIETEARPCITRSTLGLRHPSSSTTPSSIINNTTPSNHTPTHTTHTLKTPKRQVLGFLSPWKGGAASSADPIPRAAPAAAASGSTKRTSTTPAGIAMASKRPRRSSTSSMASAKSVRRVALRGGLDGVQASVLESSKGLVL